MTGQDVYASIMFAVILLFALVLSIFIIRVGGRPDDERKGRGKS